MLPSAMLNFSKLENDFEGQSPYSCQISSRSFKPKRRYGTLLMIHQIWRPSAILDSLDAYMGPPIVLQNSDKSIEYRPSFYNTKLSILYAFDLKMLDHAQKELFGTVPPKCGVISSPLAPGTQITKLGGLVVALALRLKRSGV